MPTARHTVFIIDDDDSVRRSLGRVFTSAEMPWCAFASAEEFLASSSPAPGDCIVADMTMPGMSGLELQQHLRAGQQEFAMILLTADDSEEMRLAAHAASASAFFRKPVDAQALLDAVAWAMQGRASFRN